MPREKLTDKVRQAFRAFRYLTGHYASHAGSASNSMAVHNIENGGSVSIKKVEEIIEILWGMKSLDELLDKAKGLHRPTDEQMKKRFPRGVASHRNSISQEVRDDFRAFRYFTGHHASQVNGFPGLFSSRVLEIEKGTPIAPKKVEEVIKALWGMESLDELKDKAKGLHRPSDQEIRKRFPVGWHRLESHSERHKTKSSRTERTR